MVDFVSIVGGSGHFAPVVSEDGGTIIFSSRSPLDASVVDTNGDTDVFIYDVASGRITNITAAAANDLPNVGSSAGGLSADGNLIVFSSTATNLDPTITDTNGREDVFLYNRADGTIKSITSSLPDGGYGPAISEDGRKIASVSLEGDLRIHDVGSGVTQIIATSVSFASDISFSGEDASWLLPLSRIRAATCMSTTH